MKKILAFFLIISLFFTSCTQPEKIGAKSKSTSCPQMFALWITYSELGDMYNSEKGFKAEYKKALEKCKSLGINTLFVHTRANADAFYPSKLFPYSNQLDKEPDFDMLSFMIEQTHKAGLSFHAWINPYRVSNTTSNLEETTFDSSLIIQGDGVMFFNPSLPQVKRLILDGVREIADNYDVDGIHFDDYFYLSQAESIDEKEYASYLSLVSGRPLSLAEFRRQNVTDLISSVHREAKERGLLFGVSPAANMSYNNDKMYADVEDWLKIQAVDYIMPQIYFEYEYPDPRYSFDSYLKEWKTLCAKYSPALYVGLAPYKCGTEGEWTEKSDIISRQMQQLDKDDRVSGYTLFSYSYLFNSEECYVNQLQCIKEYLG